METSSKGHVWPDLTRLKKFGKVLSIQVFWLPERPIAQILIVIFGGGGAPRTEPNYTHTDTLLHISTNLMQVAEGSHSITPGEHLKHPGGNVALCQLPVQTPGLFFIL